MAYYEAAYREQGESYRDRENLDSPDLLRNVLQPLEHKIHEYDVLMQRAHEQRVYIDEELRFKEEQRYLAETQFKAAKAKHDEYERKFQAVSDALRGDYGGDSLLNPRDRMVHFDSRPSLDSQPSIREQPKQAMRQGDAEPTDGLTPHQIFYIFGMHGIGSMIISGGINFGLAYAMYTTQDTTKNPIRLFQLPNTFAGDAAVTIIVQCILTWFIEKAIVNFDLSHQGVQPIGFIERPRNPLLRWFCSASSSDFREKEDWEAQGGLRVNNAASGIGGKLVAILQEVLRGFSLAVVGFILLWPASIGILTTVGQRDGWDYRYEDRWIPQIFKGLLGGLLGLLTSPLMATVWLVKAGWEGHCYHNLKS